MSMFCFQCEQTAKGTGCTTKGVCGKDAETAVLQDVLVEQVRLVDEEHGVDVLASELSDVGRDGVEDAGGGGLGCEAEGVADLPVEVASPERGVAAVGEAESIGGEPES